MRRQRSVLYCLNPHIPITALKRTPSGIIITVLKDVAAPSVRNNCFDIVAAAVVGLVACIYINQRTSPL